METPNQLPKSYKSIVFIVLAALLGGAFSPLSKIALKEISPIPFTLLRFLLATFTLLPFIIKQRLFRFENFRKLAFVSLLATANVMLFVFGVQRTTATIAQTLYAGVPLVAGAFSYLILKEKFHPKKLFGIIIGFIGVLVITILPIIGQPTTFNGNFIGNSIILVAVCSFALYSVLSKQFQATYSPLELTMFFILTTTVIQLLLVPFGVNHFPDWYHVSKEAIFGLLYVGILGTGVYYLIYQYAIKNATPIIASMILYLQPIFTFFWSVVLLKERITVGLIAGAVLAFIGVAFVTNFGRSDV